ncbi:MAG: hypothetical protein ACXVAF_18145 [Vulcanimicrobiaceae bacterium]
MFDHWTQQLGAWHDVYLLTGTAAATLMGLTFVVVTLRPRNVAQNLSTGVKAFTTPIVAFFATAVLISILMLVPWLAFRPLGTAVAIVGLTGLCYLMTTGAHRQWRESTLGFDDWMWYIGLPFAAYTVMLPFAAGMWFAASWALYGVAAVVVFLLILGIRNAWDVVLFIASRTQDEGQ